MKKIVLFVIPVLTISVLLAVGKKSISTEIMINAPADEVWTELTDFGKYPEWNPFIRKVTGEIKVDNSIEVTFQAGDGKTVLFTPKIMMVRKNSVLQWEGRLFMPGVFTGRHTFQLIHSGKSKTKLIHKEDFSGILVPFFNLDSTVKGFELMNKTLKERVEK